MPTAAKTANGITAATTQPRQPAYPPIAPSSPASRTSPAPTPPTAAATTRYTILHGTRPCAITRQSGEFHEFDTVGFPGGTANPGPPLMA